MTDGGARVRGLHHALDEQVRPLLTRHADRLGCRRGCSDCCIDGLTVLQLEADRIVAAHVELLRTEAPAPAGRCAFLDAEGACRVYDVRPYVCRTQGVPLRWFEEDETSGEIHEYRDICPINLEGPALATLGDEELWTLGPFEEQLLDANLELFGHERRVALRDLFAKRG